MIDKAWLSILGLFKYDPSIFDDLTLPKASELDLTLPYMVDSVEDLSVDTLKFKILMDLAEMPLVYTDPDILKYMIGRWSAARTPIWRELWKTTLYKYNPIWNKDGSYTESRNLTSSGSNSGSVQDQTYGTAHVEREDLHDVTGYDTDGYAADTRDTGEADSATSGSLSRSTTVQESGTETESITRTEQGNIGVTSTMSMIQEQRDIVLFDIYQVITDEFKKQFCIMIY